MTGWEAFWAAWLAVVALSFGVAEGVALAKGETLSKVTRRWLGVAPRRPRRRWAVPAFVVAMLTFTAWFIPHIVD